MKFLSDADLRDRGIRFSRQHRYRLIKQGRFPAPVKLGGSLNSWVETEIDEYQKKVIAERDAKQAAGKAA